MSTGRHKPTDQLKVAMTLTAEEAYALAQMCKRFTYEHAASLADRYDGGKERDHILDATTILGRSLGEALGFQVR